MSIKKIIENENVVFQEDGQTVAEISASLQDGMIALALKGNLRSDLEAYLQNEFSFYVVSSIPAINVDCSAVEKIAPGCYLELLKLKSEFLCRNRAITFVKKSETFEKFEKKHGKCL